MESARMCIISEGQVWEQTAQPGWMGRSLVLLLVLSCLQTMYPHSACARADCFHCPDLTVPVPQFMQGGREGGRKRERREEERGKERPHLKYNQLYY